MPISTQKWNQYKGIINQFAKTANKAVMIWVRSTDRVERFKEEEHESPDRVNLECLIGYNSFRTWPITKQTQSGELDNQNMLVFLNKQYLRDLGYLTAQNYFNFKPDRDYFIYQGIKYKCEGDTAVSHAHDDDLHITLILHREETLTGDDRYAYPEVQTIIQEMGISRGYFQSYNLAPTITSIIDPWVLVPPPVGFNYAYPFNIYRNTLTNEVTTDFEPTDYDFSSETSVTYHFRPDGSDAANGLTYATAKKTLQTLITTLNAAPPAGGAVFLLYTSSDNQRFTTAEMNVATGATFPLVMKSGNADGRKVICTKETTGHTVTLVSGSTYRTVRSNVSAPVDLTYLEFGKPKRLKLVTTSGLVDSTPGSYRIVNETTIDFHLWDSRNAIGDPNVLHCTRNRVFTVANNKFYCENIEFWGCIQDDTREPDTQGAINVRMGNNLLAGLYVFNNCTFAFSNRSLNVRLNELSQVLVYQCKAWGACTDGFNYHNLIGGEGSDATDINGPDVSEIDLESWDCGHTSNLANNGSTIHDAGSIVRVNHISRNNEGRNFSDIDGGQVYMIKCWSLNSPLNYSFQNAGPVELEVWLDDCQSDTPGTNDLLIDEATVRYKNMDLSGWSISNTNGTLIPY